MTITAIAIHDTKLKSMPGADADGCKFEAVKEGDHLTLKGYVNCNELGHLYLELPDEGDRTCRRWWAYAKHWRVEGTEAGNNPLEAQPNQVNLKELVESVPAKPEPVPIRFKVPGIREEVLSTQPIYWDRSTPSNFTWGEATKNGARIPTDSTITANIVKVARYMDKVRSHLGNRPILVTSWYRDPVTNRAVNGARWSRHLQGDAIDFCVIGENVVDTFYKIKNAGLAPNGFAVGNGFIHCDLRSGGSARWTYPGGPRVSLW